ncbi:hypothetical protein [Microbacterium indicum]|uniref:hypothetical protein n=1 Tax=Microbacterium indicum TaxID=358100 RepID=UPI000491089D|nr:hypothetical protein [Microbacterium indicum]
MNILVSIAMMLSAFSPMVVIMVVLFPPLPIWWADAIVVAVLVLLMFAPLLVIRRLRASRQPVTLRAAKIRRRDAEVLRFLSSFILPVTVAFFAPSDVQTVATGAMLVLFALVYVFGQLQYLNPLFAAVGYHLHSVELDDGRDVYPLSRGPLPHPSAPIVAVRFADHIYLREPAA